MTVVAHFWDGLGPVRVDSVQVTDSFRDVNQQVPFLLQRTCELCSLRCWSMRRTHPRLVSSCFWKISASFSFSQPSLLSRNLSLSFLHRSTYFSPIYPICSKHHKKQIFPLSLTLPTISGTKETVQKIFEEGRKEWRNKVPHDWSICRAWDLNLDSCPNLPHGILTFITHPTITALPLLVKVEFPSSSFQLRCGRGLFMNEASSSHWFEGLWLQRVLPYLSINAYFN